jgi:hypothetical protein
VEVLHTFNSDRLRGNGPYGNGICWSDASRPEDDDALEPRLELQEWNAPPSTRTAWQVAYRPAAVLPDGTQRISWTGFVADGEAVIGPDGLLRSVRIRDHGQAVGRSRWDNVGVDFTGFPATLAQVTPEPAC